MKRFKTLFIAVFVALAVSSIPSTAAAVANFPITGNYELDTGIGFAADLTDFTPGGFKWFNDFGMRMTNDQWLNFQFNVTAGGHGDSYCWWENNHEYRCNDVHFHGTSLELGGGVKFKWRAMPIPLQIHAKAGGALDILFLPYDVNGLAVTFRGGGGVRYFFTPTFGAGAELMLSIGPSFVGNDVGVGLYSTIDFNMGIEWHF